MNRLKFSDLDTELQNLVGSDWGSDWFRFRFAGYTDVKIPVSELSPDAFPAWFDDLGIDAKLSKCIDDAVRIYNDGDGEEFDEETATESEEAVLLNAIKMQADIKQTTMYWYRLVFSYYVNGSPDIDACFDIDADELPEKLKQDRLFFKFAVALNAWIFRAAEGSLYNDLELVLIALTSQCHSHRFSSSTDNVEDTDDWVRTVLGRHCELNGKSVPSWAKLDKPWINLGFD
jgi:hypothetical protein